MHSLQRQIRVAIALCCVALLAGVAAHLALTDIYHGEADVHLEWRALQVAAIVVAAALLIALRTLTTVLPVVRGLSRAAPYNER
jgi:hypothetical protein